jgi:hypothetical protein
MPRFSDLRSDSPLNSNLFTWLSTRAFEPTFLGSSSCSRVLTCPSPIGDRVSRVPCRALQVAGVSSNFAPGSNGGSHRLDNGRKSMSDCFWFECGLPVCELARASAVRASLWPYPNEQFQPSVEHPSTALLANGRHRHPKFAHCVLPSPSMACGLCRCRFDVSCVASIARTNGRFSEGLHKLSDLQLHGVMAHRLIIKLAAGVISSAAIPSTTLRARAGVWRTISPVNQKPLNVAQTRSTSCS